MTIIKRQQIDYLGFRNFLESINIEENNIEIKNKLKRFSLQGMELSKEYLDFNYFNSINFNDLLIIKIIILLLLFYNNHLINPIEIFSGRFYHQIDILFNICFLMSQEILERLNLKKNNLILAPGDSPSYFIYIMKLLNPEFKRLKIIEFPISGIGLKLEKGSKKEKVMKEYLRRLEDYSKYQNILIIDYSESGNSVLNLKLILKELANDIPISDYDIKTLFDYDIKKYEEVLNHESKLNSFKKYYQLKKDKKKLDDKNSIKKGIKKLKNDKEFFEIMYENEESYLKIKKELEEKRAYLGENIFNNDNDKLLKYFIDDEIELQRCQYKLKPVEGNKNLLNFMAQNRTLKDYFNNDTTIKFSYLYCNLLKCLFTIYFKDKENLYSLTKYLEQIPAIDKIFK